MKFGKLPIPYIYFILGGLALGLLLAFSSFLPYLYWNEVENYNFRRYAIPNIINYTFWGMLVPVVFYFAQRFPFTELDQDKNWLKAILASLAVAAFHEVSTNIIWSVPMHVLGYEKVDAMRIKMIVSGLATAMISRLIEYWIIYGIFSAVHYYRKLKNKQIELAQLASQLSNAELNALRLQLHPHFLFNTLNTISSLMEINTKDAQKIVSKLGTLLRTLLDKNRRNVIPLREELNFIRSYLDIEQVRFSDRLTIDYQVDEAALEILVPTLILQPLVENAIKHGFAQQSGAGVITLQAERQHAHLILTVSDDGNGSTGTAETLLRSGIGLENVKERLELLYGEAARMLVTTAPKAGFTVKLTLPVKWKEQDFQKLETEKL